MTTANKSSFTMQSLDVSPQGTGVCKGLFTNITIRFGSRNFLVLAATVMPFKPNSTPGQKLTLLDTTLKHLHSRFCYLVHRYNVLLHIILRCKLMTTMWTSCCIFSSSCVLEF